MTDSEVLALLQQSFRITLLVAAPILGTTLVLGVIVSLFQAVTQINEATLSFVPKLIGTTAILVVLGPWMIRQLVGFTQGLLLALPQLVR